LMVVGPMSRPIFKLIPPQEIRENHGHFAALVLNCVMISFISDVFHYTLLVSKYKKKIVNEL